MALRLAFALLVHTSAEATSAEDVVGIEVGSEVVVGSERQWGIVVDCGSSGTRVHIYSWSGSEIQEFTPPTPGDEALLSKTPGISTFATDPHGVIAYFSPLLVQAARWVPSAAQPLTRVRPLATAGMRLLSEAEQEPIWTAIDEAIDASAFMVGGSMTIAGEYEGLFNWLAIQHILGESASSDTTFGGLDLGGVSTQITFRPTSGVILQSAYRLVVNGSAARVYSHSYMRSGQTAAMLRVAQLLTDRDGSMDVYKSISTPCANAGLNVNYTVSCAAHGGPSTCMRQLVGAGDHNACRVLTDALLNRDNECLLPPCAAQGEYQPPPTGVTFYAVSAFFYTANSLDLVGWDGERGLSAQQIAEAGAAWCLRNWTSVAGPFTDSVCFSSAYIPSLLDAYSLPRDDNRSVRYARKVHGFTASWALGAQLFYIEEMKCEIAAAGAPAGNGTGCKPPEPRMREEVEVGAAMVLTLVLGLCIGVLLTRLCAPGKQQGKMVIFRDESATEPDAGGRAAALPAPNIA